MNDIISINRQFLIMAREASKSRSGEIMTGLSRTALDRIAQMTLDEIDAMARDIGISVISIRLTESEMDRLLSLQGLQKAAYSISVAASARPRGGIGSFQTSRQGTEA
jgi:flagellar transcriptional activator FlhD